MGVALEVDHVMDVNTRYGLDDVLAQWHCWASGYRHVGDIGSSAMFRHARSSRGWDSTDDIVDSQIDGDRMKAVDFHVMELGPMRRTAIQINARNLATGCSVWSSARLPTSLEERAIVLMEARNDLMKRLIAAGVV